MKRDLYIDIHRWKETDTKRQTDVKKYTYMKRDIHT